jgi:hypothetical protein
MSAPDIRPQLAQALRHVSLRDRIRRVSLFGSHARGSARRESDVDLLIEFFSPVGFFDLVRVQAELERSLRKPVDLVTPASLSPHIRGEALRDAVLVYEA